MWSIRRTLVVIFMLVVSVPLLLFWAWPHSRSMNNHIEQAADKHLLLARSLGAALGRYVSDLEATFDHLATAMFEARPIGGVSQLLHSLHIRHIRLIDLKTGLTLASINGSSPALPGAIDAARLGALAEVAVVRPGGLSGVMIGADGIPALYQVRVRGNRMVLARIDTTYLVEMAKAVVFGSSGHAAIVDHRGRVLAHPRTDWQRTAKDLSNVSVVSLMQNGQSGVRTYRSDAQNAEMVAGFTTVQQPGWGVMVPQQLSELTDRAGSIQTSALLVFTMGLLAATLFALRFSLVMIRPLQSVIEAARRMATGEHAVKIALPGRLVPRELHELAETFNTMAGRISQAHDSEAAARERAELANQQKTDFVRYVTHELRSPVNAILGFTRMELAARGGGQASRRDESDSQLRHIEQAGSHLLSLINDLLDMGKVEAGHYTLREEILGLDEIVDRSFRMLEHAARERDVVLNAVYERGPPAIRVDERAIYQVILNLVTNAVRYGRNGGVVELRSYRLRDGGIEICVCDDGPGMAPDDLEIVMQPFGRIEREGSDGPQGTGLGLPIVKKLVELHGGSFRLESAVGIGTVAYILLPPSRCPARADRGLARRVVA